jgi:uncharacterized surface protein with fasciclin (FAS1) repeats
MKFRYMIAASTACLLLNLPALAAQSVNTVPRAPDAPLAAETMPAVPAPAVASGEPVSLQPSMPPVATTQTQAAAPTPLPAPVAALPTPPVATTQAAQPMRATLGDAGMMYTMQREGVSAQGDAAAVASIAPAAGGASASAINTGKPARTIGGASVVPTSTIAQNIAGPSNLSTLEKAISTAQLQDSLAGTGPFTLFAPSNNAFGKLPKASFNNLQAPANRDKLTKLLNYHIVPGQHDAASIRADIKAGGGTATYATLAGENLTARVRGNTISLTDENGNRSNVALADAYQSNGVMHIVDTVLIPQ